MAKLSSLFDLLKHYFVIKRLVLGAVDRETSVRHRHCPVRCAVRSGRAGSPTPPAGPQRRAVAFTGSSRIGALPLSSDLAVHGEILEAACCSCGPRRRGARSWRWPAWRPDPPRSGRGWRRGTAIRWSRRQDVAVCPPAKPTTALVPGVFTVKKPLPAVSQASWPVVLTHGPCPAGIWPGRGRCWAAACR